jgi:hypothetical protein
VTLASSVDRANIFVMDNATIHCDKFVRKKRNEEIDVCFEEQ